MPVMCAACGKTSQDTEFCDHCNTDLQSEPFVSVPSQCPVPNRAPVPIPEKQAAALSRPESHIVLRGRTQSWRAHWISRKAWPSWEESIRHRQQVHARVLPPTVIVEDEKGHWVLVEYHAENPHWQSSANAVNDDALTKCRAMLDAARRLADTTAALHEAGCVWLNFDPRELETAPESELLRITNCDLQVFAAGPCPNQVTTRAAFAAPETIGLVSHDVGRRTDAFHVALFAYYWLANLLPNGFAGRGIQAFDYAFPPLRTFAPDLPPGLASFIRKGLAIDPADRFANPHSFVETLDEAIERAARRCQTQTPVRWEIGRHTETGRAKRALQRENEDAVLVKPFADPDRALATVTDGVTTCFVGSGALASFLTCETLNRFVDADCTSELFEDVARGACRAASEAILQWALQHGYRQQLQAGADLMGTTLCAAWLENNRMTLANVGDSRAYLIAGDFVEQLTVDGDMAGEMLLGGAPPEDVRQMGSMARALRDCVGGCTTTDDGDLRPLNAHRPQISHWSLLPGDLVVLCSDGLVDEGVFLEPEHMAEFVREHSDQSAQELAEGLTLAADELQRIPSAMEPDGFGDNISCVVIRIAKRRQKADTM